ncbi:hypothetical protein HSX11_05230 [Oxalobacteraceae bacterium]|nr:hypothetical protein [Oxalobacteraceae bacterium]
MSISKLFLACSLALASLTLAAGAHAQTGNDKKPAKHKSAKGGKAAKAEPAGAKSADPDEETDESAIGGSVVTEFDCELGNKVTVYKNDNDDAHIALRWKKRLHRLKRIGTETGALRFENKHYGLVWIGIPAKAMLLDSRQNRQLANECRNAEQAKQLGMETPAAAPSTKG